MKDCVFCNIIDGKLPSTKLYEDDLMIVIKDINPKRKIHLLAIPKKHYKLLTDMTADDALNLGKCMKKVGDLANELGLGNGFRLIINQGEDAVQTEFHLHMHLIGGERLPG